MDRKGEREQWIIGVTDKIVNYKWVLAQKTKLRVQILKIKEKKFSLIEILDTTIFLLFNDIYP